MHHSVINYKALGIKIAEARDNGECLKGMVKLFNLWLNEEEHHLDFLTALDYFNIGKTEYLENTNN